MNGLSGECQNLSIHFTEEVELNEYEKKNGRRIPTYWIDSQCVKQAQDRVNNASQADNQTLVIDESDDI